MPRTPKQIFLHRRGGHYYHGNLFGNSISTRKNWLDLFHLAYFPGNPEWNHITILRNFFPIISSSVNFPILGISLSRCWKGKEWHYLSFLLISYSLFDFSIQLAGVYHSTWNWVKFVFFFFFCIVLALHKLCEDRRVEFCHHLWPLRTREGEWRTTQYKDGIY